MFIGFSLTSCSDEENYASNKGVLISDSNVVTGTAEVNATSAKFNGSVSGLESQAASAYETGFLYGFAQDNLSEKVVASGDASAFQASVSGTTGQTLYYQAYVTLQGRVTYKGEVLSTVLTNAKATTGRPELIGNAANLTASFSDNAGCKAVGIIVSGDDDAQKAKLNGVKYPGELESEITVTVDGFVPGKTYYYTAYIDLGNGIVYGETKSFKTAEASFDIDEEFVDLGLSTKWAKRNIGAATPSDFGGLFGFGDVIGFNSSIKTEDYACENTYKTPEDVAYVAYGGKAMLPTADEYEELFRCCDVEWTEEDGVKGYKFTSRSNGNSIFLPCAGSRTQSNFSGMGTDGHYMTGSINPSDMQFCISYDFNSAFNGRGTQPVYTALSARAVTTAKNVPFDKTKLYQKWYLDNGQDGKQHVFEGPFTQFGYHDTYGTITNGEPNIYEDIHWEMGKDNGWIGYTYEKDYGYMEFKEDGTCNIHRIAEDGTVTDEVANYTIDENAKTITIDKDVIYANTWLGTKSGTLNIFSLNDNQLQIALPDYDGIYKYALNYYSETKRVADELIPVFVTCVDGDFNGNWGTQVDAIAPTELNGTHTLKFEGACNGSKVNLIDLKGFYAKYPNATVVVTDIKLDGKSIAFDGNKFRYGDIENNGNFRVELFNIWGKANKNETVDSPFSDAGFVGSDPAFTFAESLEITYNINTEGQTTYTPNLVTINPSWGGDWGYNDGTKFNVAINKETAMYELSQTSFSMTLIVLGNDMLPGSIMTFIETDKLFMTFPNIKMQLDQITLDTLPLEGWDASKIVNTSADGNGIKHRLELWNSFGETSNSGCAFGTPDGGVIKELGFSKSMKLDFSIKSLF